MKFKNFVCLICGKQYTKLPQKQGITGCLQCESKVLEIQPNEIHKRATEWQLEAAWVYEDKRFLTIFKNFFMEYYPDGTISVNNVNSAYTQYLCTADLEYHGDLVHCWRDGQTWWPIVGDYSEEQMIKFEIFLRSMILIYFQAHEDKVLKKQIKRRLE